MTIFGLFQSALHVEASQTFLVPEGLRAHESQRQEKVWLVAVRKPEHSITKLRIEQPGLTTVRINPQLVDQQQVLARVRVTSDDAQHLERVSVGIKKKSRLDCGFKNTKLPIAGSLVTEIELAQEGLIEEVIARVGGDVVIEDGVLARAETSAVTVAAMDHGQLFVYNPGPLNIAELYVASLSCGQLWFSSGPIVAKACLLAAVLGDGGVEMKIARVETDEFDVLVAGERGRVDIAASGTITAKTMETYLWDAGSIAVRAPPPAGGVVSCESQTVEITGRGCIDVADVVAESTSVSLSEAARAIVQPRGRLALQCDAVATVECIDSLPQQVERSSAYRSDDLVVTSLDDRKIRRSKELAFPARPSIAEAFANPKDLVAKKAGFRETIRPLFVTIRNGSAIIEWIEEIIDMAT